MVYYDSRKVSLKFGDSKQGLLVFELVIGLCDELFGLHF